MLILDENKLSSFLGSIAQGLVISPFQLFLLILFLAAFIFFLIWFYRHQHKKVLSLKIKYSQKLYDKYIDKFQLNPSETELIEKLTTFIRDRDTSKHQIFASQRIFNLCASKLLAADSSVSQSAIAALRVKLGFTLKDRESNIHSTAELPEKLKLYVLQGKLRRFKGTITGIVPGALAVRLEDDKIPPASGSNITVVFQRKNGIFSFRSHVIKLEGGTIYIAHSEQIKLTQKRKYYRKNISLPLLIRVAGSSEKVVQSRFLDLGGGGASIVNPEKRFKQGDDVELIFYISREERISIIGEVIRTSRNGDIMHVSFETIRESVRDRIIGFILSYSESVSK
ncbi:MAG: hypothetical protein DRP57_08280 [Spirochaetes bacterium]|nr:MAG: hypothetical protein DRP57_08280 [Spirochaetota bacterium]